MHVIVHVPILSLFQPLTVKQIKNIQALIEKANEKCVVEMKECETERHFHLTQIGNMLHPSVPISDDEVHVCIHAMCTSTN